MKLLGSKNHRMSHQATIENIQMEIENHIEHDDKEKALGVPVSEQGSRSSSRSFSGVSSSAFRRRGSSILSGLIMVLGIVTSASFLGIGMSAALDQIEDDFHRGALDTESNVADAFADYVNIASLVHNRCRHNFTRTDFWELYEYLISGGLKFKAVQFVSNISHTERPAAEAEARAFYAENYPQVDYQGFRGFNTPDSGLVPRWNQSFYFPIHYQQPIAGNEAAIDLDYYSSESRIRAVDAVFENKGPSLTDRLSLVSEGSQKSRCGVDNVASYGVVLMHPGVELSSQPDVWPRDFASIVICIPDLITRSVSTESTDSKIFIHDISDPNSSGEPVFLGAASVMTSGDGVSIEFIEEEPFADLTDSAALVHQKDIMAANRVWTVTVVRMDRRWDNSMIFIIFGAVIILFASIALAIWVRADDKRTKKFNEIRQEAEHEKAALILKNARQATKTERELNDFIAHEVRNPVAAAMAASNFLQVEVTKDQPLADEESRELAREDMNIIENALKFVNDLLRNMLDMHRAASKQLQVTMVPTDLFHDILEPVGGMLHRRGSKVKMIVDCPEDLWIMADPLRLKQVILNLGRNSSKFIDEGYIRLKAEDVDGNVTLYVDDSGYGIPADKRDRLFAKYQESLDMLSQGTGIGLSLCKSLVELMGGEISLDDDFFSGIKGHPGTRFVIDMKAGSIDPPTEQDFFHSMQENSTGRTEQLSDSDSFPFELPDNLRILFVDDDSILRKLFKRSVKRIAPSWVVREAGNGETALALTENENEKEEFDIIFVDMYMASVEKQLLGTETVAALRKRGIKTRMCGLSANDKEAEFLAAGADAFMFKPFPCEAHELQQALCEILHPSKINRSKG